MQSDSDRVRHALDRLGLSLPAPPGAVATYEPGLVIGDLLWISGQIPLRDGALIAEGCVPDQVDEGTAIECARQCVLNALAVAQRSLGSLERIERVVKLGAFVASGSGYGRHPIIANGASELLIEIFGESGRHTRAAVGVASLPLNAPVEIEFVFLTRDA